MARGEDQRIVFQGVHMLMGAEMGGAWKEGKVRNSKMVFIGKDLPREILKKGMAQCVAPRD